MRSKKSIFQRIPNSILFVFILILFFSKLLMYILLKNQYINMELGGGSDADYYHAYVKGYTGIAANIWPVLLRYLNDINLYSREFISYIFLFLNLFVIPVIIARLVQIKIGKNQKYYFYIFLICLLYPTLYFFTFDIYRDIFMVLVFLIGCLIVKSTLNSNNILIFIVLFSICILISLFLGALRPYLGAAFFGSLLLFNIRFTKRRLILLGFIYLIALWAASYVGIFDSLTEYRAGFEEAEGGSNLGIDFSNPIMFIPNFILSFLGQMLGFYITNPLAIVLLLIETIPFLFMLVYVIKNIRWADKFIRFLIIFFVLYGSVWLIGNDNLGTAVRLRLYNYFAIYISFFYILNLKEKSLRKYIR